MTKKYYKIQLLWLTFSQQSRGDSKLFIFDGPGIKSRCFTEEIYNMSLTQINFNSFIASVYLFVMTPESVSPSCVYYEADTTRDLLTKYDNGSIYFPGSTCVYNRTIHCVINITSPVGLFPNITLTHYTFDGMENSVCLYCGFSIYTVMKNSIEDLYHFCGIYENFQLSDIPYFHGSSSTMYIVFYFYKPYVQRFQVGGLLRS